MGATLIWPNPDVQSPEDLKVLRSLAEILASMPAQDVGGDQHSFSIKLQMPKLYLVDGTTLSVQASALHHCTPQNDVGPYSAVEVGFPSADVPPTWEPYCDGDWVPNGSNRGVFAYVPMIDVMFFIGAHGGVDFDRTFRDFRFALR
jgi:hypothetical protein